MQGELVHDFGAVVMEPGETVELQHTFRLTNTTSDAVQVNAARPDCGCVNARQGLPALVLPGETLELPISMAFSAASKKVVIHLELENRPAQKLLVMAKADFLPKVRCSDSEIAVPLRTSHTQQFLVDYYDDNSAPPPPAFTHPSNVRCRFIEWELVEASRQLHVWPSVWQGTFEISADKPISDDDQVSLTVGRSRSLTIPLAKGPAHESGSPGNPAASAPSDH